MLKHDLVYGDEYAPKIRELFEPIYRVANPDSWVNLDVALERRGNHYIEGEVDEAYFMFAQGYLTCKLSN